MALRRQSAQRMPAAARFVAFGGVWLDEIRKMGRTLQKNVVGGSVTYATLGARIFLPGDPRSVRMLLVEGSNFSSEVMHTLQDWRVDLMFLARGDVPSASGILHYGESESDRYYERLTLPLNTTPDDLDQSDLLAAQCFHFFEAPATLLESTNKILDARRKVYGAILGVRAPLFIWEPQAKSCTPATFEEHLSAANAVDVFSPNHVELAGFFRNGQPHAFDPSQVVQDAMYFVERGIGMGKGCAVVRCAEHGCLVVSRAIPPTWLPAFYTPESDKVVNTTGAGNAFLGAFAIGYQESGSYVEAAKYGAVAASFVLEQIGVPSLLGRDTEEVWNGESVQHRLESYWKRCESAH